MIKKCCTCKYCEQLCSRFGYSFLADKAYLCTIKEDLTEPQNSCEHWTKKKISYNFSAQRFDDVEKDIKTLICLLND